MPTLVLEAPGKSRRHVKLFKPMTTIGAGPDNDISVPNASLEPTHAHVDKDGDRFVLVGMTRDMTVNGRREKKRKLEDRDLVRIGDVTATFYANDADAPPLRPSVVTAAPGVPSGATRDVMGAYRKVHEFSMKLLGNESTQALVETILDSIIELTGAAKGFLILLDDDAKPMVSAARNVGAGSIDNAIAQLSDSILKKVISTKKPLIVADALRDEEFNASESVVNLKLLSVMCCPLLDRDQLKGVLYVGNDRISNVFNEEALDVMNVFAAQASLLLSQAERIDDLSSEKDALTEQIDQLRFGSIVGSCDSMKEVFKRVRKVATADISVLVTGETGTGKELIAREIHNHSRRVKGPFVVINCGAIPENLLESELFGHVRGAFTGAVSDRVGRFQAADGGTLFLDEIGEMPLPLQVKLLRALQEHVVIKVGAVESEKIDIRVVAATNRVLEDEIKANRFREDLYYRLNVVNVHLPPLRDRGGDLEIIARYLLATCAKEHNPKIRGFTKSCLVAMRKYSWPGNIRQLENRIKKGTVLAEKNMITAEDLDLQPSDLEDILPLADAKERFQIRYINEILERNGGNRTKTAKDLGVDARTIFRHLKKLNSPIPAETDELGLESGPEDAERPPRL